MSKWIFAPLLLLLICFLPYIASTPLCKPLFSRALSAQIGSLHFSWFGPQSFRQIQWNLDDVNANAEELQIDAPFWSFSGPFLLKKGCLSYQGSSIIQILGSVKGRLSQNALTLQEPVQASIQIDSKISEILFHDANPHFLKGIQTKDPILVHIDPNFFSFPRPFSLGEFKVRGNLDLGWLICENGKTLASFVALATGAESPVRQMSGQFTPMEFQLDRGLLKTGRMDALFEHAIHVCTWGDIDLLNDLLTMNIGLSADTLERSFGIQNLDPNYVLKVPIQGSLRDPEIVKGPAAAQIAALIAAKKLSKKTIFGKVADALSRPTLDPDIPPAKHPFPWEN